jgi:hypothetical protein
MIFVPGSEPELPLSRKERRAYQKALADLLARANLEASAREGQEAWEQMQSKAQLELDQHGRVVLQTKIGPPVVNAGISGNNVLAAQAPSAIYSGAAHSEAAIRIAEE